jgi:hypothetical protein
MAGEFYATRSAPSVLAVWDLDRAFIADIVCDFGEVEDVVEPDVAVENGFV